MNNPTWIVFLMICSIFLEVTISVPGSWFMINTRLQNLWSFGSSNHVHKKTQPIHHQTETQAVAAASLQVKAPCWSWRPTASRGQTPGAHVQWCWRARTCPAQREIWCCWLTRSVPSSEIQKESSNSYNQMRIFQFMTIIEYWLPIFNWNLPNANSYNRMLSISKSFTTSTGNLLALLLWRPLDI